MCREHSSSRTKVGLDVRTGNQNGLVLDLHLSLLQRPLLTGWFGAGSSQDPTLQDPITGCTLQQQGEQRKEGRLHPAVDAAFFVPVLLKVKAAAGAPKHLVI